jgi:membrane protease YdiL (CAAX protease family)
VHKALIVNAVISALLNLMIFAGLPFLFFFAYHKCYRKSGFREIARRAGLQFGEGRFIGYSLAFALAAAAILIIWPLPLTPLIRVGSPQRAFVGLGVSGTSIALALLYGVAKTGFPEEFFFRGLIAGSLSRRLPLPGANIGQALIFLFPHLFVLRIMPEMWVLLPLTFMGALFAGWVRLRSGSIIGPCLIHSTLNVVLCLIVAGRTAS